MKKRFVVAVESSTSEQSAALVEFFEERGVGWWHYLPNLWLISDSNGKLDASEIRDELRLLIPGEHSLVLEFRADGDTWAGFGPKSERRNMFKWIRGNWTPEE